MLGQNAALPPAEALASRTASYAAAACAIAETVLHSRLERERRAHAGAFLHAAFRTAHDGPRKGDTGACGFVRSCGKATLMALYEAGLLTGLRHMSQRFGWSIIRQQSAV